MRGRAILATVALCCLTPLLLAMGGGGTPSSDSIPRPQERYTAEIVDRQGITTRVSLFSCNGKTFFPLDRGEGTLMVPFSKVARVKLGADKGNAMDVTVVAEGGKSLEGRLPRTLLCTGATDLGNYQIELRGIKEIAFSK
jgi:hypothetical protein